MKAGGKSAGFPNATVAWNHGAHLCGATAGGVLRRPRDARFPRQCGESDRLLPPTQGCAGVTPYAIELAVFVGLIFFWLLRNRLCVVESNRQLATIGFAGGVVLAASGGLQAGIVLALTNSVTHVAPSVMQTLNVLENDLSVFMVNVGTGLFLVMMGTAIVRSRTLPRWLGWIGVVLGVASLVIPAPPIAVGLWILMASIVILAQARQASQGAVAVAT